MPNDDLEALIGEHDSVYGQEVINVITKTREKKIEAFGILGIGHQGAP